jgi:phosphate starvation-inducible membrane PsiE
MQFLRSYGNIVILFIMFLALNLIDLVMYYGRSAHHSQVPFALSCGLTVVVFIITCQATYETFRHRHDKEQW